MQRMNIRRPSLMRGTPMNSHSTRNTAGQVNNIVKAHNTKVLRKQEEINKKEERSCNCRDTTLSPIANNCLKSSVVYKATVEYENKTVNYIGMMENSFKTRYNLHKSSLNHNKNQKQTELSSLTWSLKDNNTP